MPTRVIEADRQVAVWHTPLKINWPVRPVAGGYDFESVFTYTLVLPAISQAFAVLRPTIDASALRSDFDPASTQLEALPRVPVAEWLEHAVVPTRQLAEQVGYFELELMARALPGADLSPVFGREMFGPTPRPTTLGTAPVLDEQISAFLLRYGDPLGRVSATLARLASDVLTTASKGARFPAGRAGDAAAFWNDRQPTTTLGRFKMASGGRSRRVWAHTPAATTAGWSLLDRVALEAEQLAFQRPRLQLCDTCGRPFVALVRESNCRGHLWSWPNGPLRAACRRDATFSVTARTRRSRSEEERYRDRTYQQILRWRDQRERSDDPEMKDRLSRLIDDLTEERKARLKRRGPSTVTPVVTEDISDPKGK